MTTGSPGVHRVARRTGRRGLVGRPRSWVISPSSLTVNSGSAAGRGARRNTRRRLGALPARADVAGGRDGTLRSSAHAIAIHVFYRRIVCSPRRQSAPVEFEDDDDHRRASPRPTVRSRSPGATAPSPATPGSGCATTPTTPRRCTRSRNSASCTPPRVPRDLAGARRAARPRHRRRHVERRPLRRTRCCPSSSSLAFASRARPAPWSTCRRTLGRPLDRGHDTDRGVRRGDGFRRRCARLADHSPLHTASASSPAPRPTAAATEALLRRIGYVRETIFGGIWEFTADLAKADTAYTNLELRPHTDGTYSHDAPGRAAAALPRSSTARAARARWSTGSPSPPAAQRAPRALRTLSTRAGARAVHRRRLAPDGRPTRVSATITRASSSRCRSTTTTARRSCCRGRDARRSTTRCARSSTVANDPGDAVAPRPCAGRGDVVRQLAGAARAHRLHRHRRLCGGYVNREDVESRLRQLL